MTLTRRKLISVATTLAAPWVMTSSKAQKVEFSVKFGSNLPATHPLNTQAVALAAKLKTESKGRIDLQVFPFNQLGNDTDMLSQ